MLEKYGVHENKSTLVILFMPLYQPDTLPALLNKFMSLNTSHVPGILPIFDNLRNKLPKSFKHDEIQKHLGMLLKRWSHI